MINNPPMDHNSWTIKGLLTVSTNYFKEKGIENPRLNAETLLAHQLKTGRLELYLHFDKPLKASEVSGYRALVRRRLKGEPLQYLTGVQEFWSLEFLVDSSVLIPRPESELLVEIAVTRVKDVLGSGECGPTILDLGTGCGVLAVSLAKEIPEARLVATDISSKAVELAYVNAERHKVSERIEFREGDLWDPLTPQDPGFDVIVANPPYVASEDYGDLPPEVRDYEPRMALDGGSAGMKLIEGIISESIYYLKPAGVLIVEMAPEQTGKAISMLSKIDGFGGIRRVKDYSGAYRVVAAEKESR